MTVIGVEYPSITQEYARVKLVANAALGTQTVELAFMADYDTKPGDSDWHAATWLEVDQTGPPSWSQHVGVMIGPSNLVLALGTWEMWFRLTDTPERPARRAGRITIT